MRGRPPVTNFSNVNEYNEARVHGKARLDPGLLLRDAVYNAYSADSAVARFLSVRPSVTISYRIKTAESADGKTNVDDKL